MVAATLPYEMEGSREEAAEEWYVDVAELDRLTSAGLKWRGLARATSLLDRVNLYHALGELRQRLNEHAADPSLSKEGIVARVCEFRRRVLELSRRDGLSQKSCRQMENSAQARS